MKKYIVTLCLISAAAALMISGSGSWALLFWSIGILSVMTALILWLVNWKRTTMNSRN